MGWFSKKQTPVTDNIEVVTEDEDKKVASVEADDNAGTEDKKTGGEISDNELEKLRKELAAEKEEKLRYKTEAEQSKRQTTETAGKLSTETDNRLKAEEVAIANGITAFTANADTIKRKLVEAQEAGKFSEAAELQQQLSSAQFKIDEWNNKKANLEIEKKQPKQVVQVQPSQDEMVAKELEGFNRHPLVKEWLGKNPKFFTDAKFRTKVDAAHYDAEDAGLAFGTKEYCDYVDNVINGGGQKQEPRQEQKQEPRRTSTALPPSRSTNTMSNNTGKETIKLSAQEVEYAQIANPQLYAKDPAKACAMYAAAQKQLLDEGKIRRWN